MCVHSMDDAHKKEVPHRKFKLVSRKIIDANSVRILKKNVLPYEMNQNCEEGNNAQLSLLLLCMDELKLKPFVSVS